MPIADESRQIAKARKKLQKKLDVMDRQFTDSALKETVERIYDWLDKNATSRIPLTNKKVRLFDGNNHPAAPSSINERFKEALQKEHQEMDRKAKSLLGRVSAGGAKSSITLPSGEAGRPETKGASKPSNK